MFAKSGNTPETVNVKPPVAERYELRVIVWSVADAKLIEDGFFSGEKHGDIYVKGLVGAPDSSNFVFVVRSTRR